MWPIAPLTGTLTLTELLFPLLTQGLVLDQDITLEEVQLAITQLKPGKPPGVDGLPTEFYLQQLDFLAPRITTLLEHFL